MAFRPDDASGGSVDHSGLPEGCPDVDLDAWDARRREWLVGYAERLVRIYERPDMEWEDRRALAYALVLVRERIGEP